MDPSVAAAGIQAGASLLSGLFGRRKKSGIDYVAMRDAALKAGFDPLTVLGASGGAGFETGGELTGAGFMAQALKQGVDSWFNAQDMERDREMDDLKRKVLEAELDEIQKNTALPQRGGFGFDIPQIVTQTEVTLGQDPTFGVHVDDPITFEIEQDAYKNAVNGTVVEWADELIDRNRPSLQQAMDDASFGAQFGDWIRRGVKDTYLGDARPPAWSSGFVMPDGWAWPGAN